MTVKTPELASEIDQTATTAEAEAAYATESALESMQDAAVILSERAADVPGQVAAPLQDSMAAGTQRLEAMMQHAGKAAKCLEAINAETMAFARQSVDDGLAAAEAMATIRSIHELIDVQGQYSRAAFDRFVNYATKLNDLLLGATREMLEPLGGGVFGLPRRA